MDVNALRLAVEVLSFAAFIGIVAWAWSARRRSDFERAAAIPFDHE